MDENHKLIVVPLSTYEALKKAKLVDCETFYSVIDRALQALPKKN